MPKLPKKTKPKKKVKLPPAKTKKGLAIRGLV